jgi:hypothetical protein
MESRFLYFYPRNRHRGFDPVNVTNKLEQTCCGIFLTVSWQLNLTFFMLTQQNPLHEFSKSEKRMDANTNHGVYAVKGLYSGKETDG